MNNYYKYSVIETKACYYPTDLECEINAHCKLGYKLVSVMPKPDAYCVYWLTFEEQVY